MVSRKPSVQVRCDWAGTEPLLVAYHDEEWGVPVQDDRTLFEFLILEGAQAGLSWLTILRKRAAYRHAFAGFEPERVARFDARKVSSLLRDPGIVRNRAKVGSAVANARAFLRVQAEFGSFAAYQWRFVEGRPLQALGRQVQRRIHQLAVRLQAHLQARVQRPRDLAQRGNVPLAVIRVLDSR